ncbi:hypothetical protein [Massilia sp. TN1-12]|uniref:hypothetical protein n=1 Tax=Massilia paldalensis TaxID=3377675 RepID=UPI00384D5F34
MKVTKHQAKDGSLHDSAKLCEAHNRKLKLAPAMEKFVNSLAADAPGLGKTDNEHPVIYLEDLPAFLTAHAELLQATIVNATVVRKPRKPKAPAANDGKAAAA